MTDRPLRILQIVDTLDSGGMEQQLVALMNRMDASQFQFEVCCLRHAGVNAVKLRSDIAVHPLLKAEGFQTNVIQQIRHLLKRGFDVVHSHNIGPFIYAALATLGGRTIPLLHGEHAQFTPAEFGFKRLWQRRLLYRCATAVHTVSAGQKEELLRNGLKHPHLTAILNGVNTQHFTFAPDAQTRTELRNRLGLGNDPQHFLLGIVARFGAFKRHAALISAFENLASEFPDLRLLMVGDGGPEKERVLAQAKQSPVHDRIHWTGYQSDPAPYYQAMDLLAVPSSNEGLSNTTLEAMASGVPVLSNDICGARELLAEEQGGWVRDLSTIDLLTAELRHVIRQSRAQLHEIGQSGRKRTIDKFSWSAMADNYAAWFRACAGRAAFPPV